MKMVKKLPSQLCKKLDYLVEDERKAQVEYLNLEEKVRSTPLFHRKGELVKALSDIGKDETKHELKLDFLRSQICKRK